MEKMAIFGSKPWVNPHWKHVNFFQFWTSCFYSLARRFFLLKYLKRHFPGLYCLEKKMEIWPFLDQNHGLTLWKNVNFSIFWTFRFYSLERRFLVLKYHKRHFPGLYCVKKKRWKVAIFAQSHGLTPLEKCPFFDFLKLLVFIA